MILRPKRQLPPKPTLLETLLAKPVYNEIPIAVVQHCKAVPLGVMVRGTMEWLLDEPMVELLFQKHAPDQYTRELTVSALIKPFCIRRESSEGILHSPSASGQLALRRHQQTKEVWRNRNGCGL